MYFQTKLTKTYNALLNVESVARDKWSPPPSMDEKACSMDGDPIRPQVAFSIFKTPQAFYFIPSSSPRPLFNAIPLHPWIFHPIHRSTSNTIDDYVSRPMNGDYPLVVCNSNISWGGWSLRNSVYVPSPSPSRRISPCVTRFQCKPL